MLLVEAFPFICLVHHPAPTLGELEGGPSFRILPFIGQLATLHQVLASELDINTWLSHLTAPVEDDVLVRARLVVH